MIYIVDDDKAVRLALGVALKHSGYEYRTFEGPDDLLTAVRARCPELIISDMNFGTRIDGNDGLELLQRLKILCPTVPVILITAWGSIPLAVEGVKAGAFDFITKPWNGRLLMQRVATALELSRPAEAAAEFRRDGIIGESKALRRVLDMAARIAPTDAPVLITGENGTGKEMLARAIHNNSRRATGPFIAVNAGAMPRELFESEMFGYVRGAFTGAAADREGRFALADGGTIFLDEVGELDINSQVKLLRVLQEHTFEPLGSSRQQKSDFRVICATNADLAAKIKDRTFREDLFYRINTIEIQMPGLDERRSDIPLLANHFLDTIAPGHTAIPVPSLRKLAAMHFPGNIRQLKNVVERAWYSDTALGADAFDAGTAQQPDTAANGGDLRTLDQLERTAIIEALRRNRLNMTAAAAELGITRQSLGRRIEKYGIDTGTIL